MTSVFDFSKVEDDILQLGVDGKTYGLTHDGKVLLDTVEVTDTAVLKKVEKEAAAAAKNFVSVKATDESQAMLVRGVIDAHKAKPEFEAVAKIAEATEALEAKITALPLDRVANEAELKELRVILAKTPDAQNILDVDNFKKLNQKIKVDGKEVAIIDQAALGASAKKLREGGEKLAEMAEKGTATEAEVRKLLLSTPDLKHVVEADVKVALENPPKAYTSTATSIKFDTFTSGIETEIATHNTAIERLAGEAQALHTQLETAGRFGKNKAAKALENKVAETTKYITEHAEFKPHMDAALKSKLGTDGLKTLGEVKGMNTVLADLGKAGGAGEKKGGGIIPTVKGLYFRSPELIAKRIEKARSSGATMEEIAKIEKSVGGARWGSIIGTVAALTGIYIASTGKKNNNEKQQAVLNERNDQEVAVAR